MRDPTQEAGGRAMSLQRVSHNFRLWYARALHGIRRALRRLNIRAHHVRRGGLVAAGVGAAAIFFLVGAVLRLLVGPISLGPLKGEISNSLERTLPGIAVRFDDAALEWSRDEGKLNLVILGARVFGADQRIIAQAPKAEIVVSASALFQGSLEVRSIALVGVQLTLVRTQRGDLRLGVEGDKNQTDVLQRIREALSKSSGPSTLDSVAVRHARLAFYDERTGAFVVAPEASLQLSAASNRSQKVSVDAQIEISGKPAHVIADASLPNDSTEVTGSVSVKGLNLKALGENTRQFEALKPFDISTELTGTFTVRDGVHLLYADFGLGAEGKVHGFGPDIDVKTMRIVGRYDGRTGRLLIDDATLAGKAASAHFEGSGDLSFDKTGIFTGIKLGLEGEEIAVNVPAQLRGTVKLAHVSVRVGYDAPSRIISLEKFSMQGGALTVDFAGQVRMAQDMSPAIDMDGTIAEIGVRDLLRYWPKSIAEGARDWIDTNMPAGRLGPVVVHTRIAEGALDAPALPNDALDVQFPIRNATAVYIDGLTPLTNANGRAALEGDRFEATVESGMVGTIKFANGKVVIENLHEHGAVAQTTARATGSMTELLQLIDHKPLNYPSRFKIDPKAMKGAATVDLNFRIPTLKDLRVDDVGIGVKAAVAGFSYPLSPSIKITDGAVTFQVDNKALRATGDVRMSGAPVNLDWTETFNPVGPFSTHAVVKGRMDDDARAALNFHVGDLISGPTIVNATIDGVRGTIRSARMTVDLTPTTVKAEILNFRKAAGVPATAIVNAKFSGQNDIQSEEVTLTGGGLSARATVQFGTNGDLERVDVPTLVAGANDFSVTLSDTTAGLVLNMSGRSVDGTALGARNPFQSSDKDQERPSSKIAASNKPFRISANLDKVILREGVTMSPFAFEVAGIGDRPQTLALTGSFSKTEKLSGNIVTSDAGRKLSIAADNAGQFFRGVFGFKSMRDGKLTVDVTLPPAAGTRDASAPDYSGTLSIKNFRIVDQPFLTRVFTAGSLEGLVNLMRNDGIVVDKFVLPFKAKDNVFTIRDARASGPSIGVSAEGFVDRGRNELGLRGAIAPLYGINSVLGAIPLVGDVLVSKQGEGVIGMSYSVSGNADEPKISMNPLSVLAPGIFRRIFEGSMPRETRSQPDPVQPPTDAQQPEPKKSP